MKRLFTLSPGAAIGNVSLTSFAARIPAVDTKWPAQFDDSLTTNTIMKHL